jgi:hypothetical protein
MGDLLELTWLAEAATRHAQDDATPALLTSLAGYYLLVPENQFDHSTLNTLIANATPLIEQSPIRVQVSNL